MPHQSCPRPSASFWRTARAVRPHPSIRRHLQFLIPSLPQEALNSLCLGLDPLVLDNLTIVIIFHQFSPTEVGNLLRCSTTHLTRGELDRTDVHHTRQMTLE